MRIKVNVTTEHWRVVSSDWVCEDTRVVEGIAESIGLGPDSVSNSLSCSNRSLDQGEELGGRELRRG
jgi:hypothetical protein